MIETRSFQAAANISFCMSAIGNPGTPGETAIFEELEHHVVEARSPVHTWRPDFLATAVAFFSVAWTIVTILSSVA